MPQSSIMNNAIMNIMVLLAERAIIENLIMTHAMMGKYDFTLIDELDQTDAELAKEV